MSKATGVKGKTPDKLRRFEDAMRREAERADRTAEEQFERLKSREGNSTREKNRLLKGMGNDL